MLIWFCSGEDCLKYSKQADPVAEVKGDAIFKPVRLQGKRSVFFLRGIIIFNSGDLLRAHPRARQHYREFLTAVVNDLLRIVAQR